MSNVRANTSVMISRLCVALFAIASIAPKIARADDAPSFEEQSTEIKFPYVQFLATSFIGDGLRFNNPYRLATPLGSNAESISRTAAYGDVGLTAMTGNPSGLQHGLTLRLSFSLEGVQQSVLTPSYIAWKRWDSFALCGRLGVPIVTSPQTNVGFEGAVGGAYFFRAGLGVVAEGVFDLFYGAGTREVAHPTYPVASVQIGIVVAYELLP
jgi:hypothetical protein